MFMPQIDLHSSIGRYLLAFGLRNNNLTEITLKKGSPIVSLLKIILSHTRAFQLLDVWAVDYPLNSLNGRFELNYYFLLLDVAQRIRVRTFVSENESIHSLTTFLRSANWFEREIWDMFGVFFSEHPDLRRILSDYGFEGFPLRKDFPLSGYVQVRFDDEAKRVLVEPLFITQEFRAFDFSSPWERKSSNS
jgi:NADH:ubiquinone oxidoreductase subunit C